MVVVHVVSDAWTRACNLQAFSLDTLELNISICFAFSLFCFANRRTIIILLRFEVKKIRQLKDGHVTRTSINIECFKRFICHPFVVVEYNYMYEYNSLVIDVSC